MRRPLLLSLCIVSTMLARPSWAQRGEGPVIVLIETDRDVGVTAHADNDIGQDITDDLTDGLFDASATAAETGEHGSSASGSASQDTVVTNSEISGTLFTSGQAARGGGDPDAEGRISSTANVFTSFTVPVDTAFTLTGSFVVNDEVLAACGASATAGIAGIDATGSVFIFSAGYCDEDPPGESSFQYVGSIQAGQTINLGVTADVYMEESELISLPGSGSAVVDFVFFFGVPEVFVDGFESGDLDAWSSSPP